MESTKEQQGTATEYLTYEDVAKMVNRSVPTVQHFVVEHNIPRFRQRNVNRNLLRRQDVDEMLVIMNQPESKMIFEPIPRGREDEYVTLEEAAVLVNRSVASIQRHARRLGLTMHQHWPNGRKHLYRPDLEKLPWFTHSRELR